jgi:hypothetical protein
MTSADVRAAAQVDRAAASRDDDDAFEAAVRPHYANLVRRLVLVLGDPHDAEDVAQDAYLKAYRSWDRFDGVDVRAWLYTIALRLAFNQLRGRRRWLAAIGRIEHRPWSDPSDPDLAAALATLDVRPRSCSTSSTATPRPRSAGCCRSPKGPSRAGSHAAAWRSARSSVRGGEPGTLIAQPASRSGSANWLSYRSK